MPATWFEGHAVEHHHRRQDVAWQDPEPTQRIRPRRSARHVCVEEDRPLANRRSSHERAPIIWVGRSTRTTRQAVLGDRLGTEARGFANSGETKRRPSTFGVGKEQGVGQVVHQNRDR